MHRNNFRDTQVSIKNREIMVFLNFLKVFKYCMLPFEQILAMPSPMQLDYRVYTCRTSSALQVEEIVHKYISEGSNVPSRFVVLYNNIYIYIYMCVFGHLHLKY